MTPVCFFFPLQSFSLWSSLQFIFNEMLFFQITEELKDYLFESHAINKIITLGNSTFPVSWENEIKLWTFLETRSALLLKTYKTTSEVSHFNLKLIVVYCESLLWQWEGKLGLASELLA